MSTPSAERALSEAARDSEQRARVLGLEPTIGGEPTFTVPLTAAAEWRSEAVGQDKRARAETFARALARRIGAVVDEIPGRRYEGESQPRFCLRIARARQIAMIVPDPGVLELNLPPAGRFAALARFLSAAYDAAGEAGLAAHRVLHNGRVLGSGGGAHVTLGGPTRERSPFVRRPSLVHELVAYACNHPSLSYALIGLAAGQTSQAPRADEAGPDRLRDLAIARATLSARADALRVEEVHASLAALLSDVTGNTHRAEVNVEKLATAGIVELRAVEAQPTAEAWLAAAVLWRALLVRLAERPYRAPLVDWGSRLHDEWTLPARIRADLEAVLADVGLPSGLLDDALEHRYPLLGVLEARGVRCEVRQALEPWPVVGPLAAQESAASRIVDSSTDRLEVRCRGGRSAEIVVLAAGRPVPALSIGRARVGAVRYRSGWPAPGGLHPLVQPHGPVDLALVERGSGRVLARAAYHPWHPEGGVWASPPRDLEEAAERRRARFVAGAAGGRIRARIDEPGLGATLDLLRVGR